MALPLLAHIQAKGHKTRCLKIHDILYQFLTTWLAATEKPELTKNTQFEGITRLVAQHTHTADLAPERYQRAPLNLDRTCARYANDNSVPFPKIQQLLGYDETTTDYVRY